MNNIESTKKKLFPEGVKDVRDAIEQVLDQEKVVGMIIAKLEKMVQKIEARSREMFNFRVAAEISDEYGVDLNSSEMPKNGDYLKTIASLIYEKLKNSGE